MSRPAPLLVAVALGFLAWLSEGVALGVVLKGLDPELNLQQVLPAAVPIYGGAMLVGAITTLPGGLVGTEGVMVALLQQLGTGRGAAVLGTLLVRVATLWFAVVIGLAALAYLHLWYRGGCTPGFKRLSKARAAFPLPTPRRRTD